MATLTVVKNGHQNEMHCEDEIEHWCPQNPLKIRGRVDPSLETYMMCEGGYEIKPPIHENYIEKTSVYVLMEG